jgi:hypothetical protein
MTMDLRKYIAQPFKKIDPNISVHWPEERIEDAIVLVLVLNLNMLELDDSCLEQLTVLKLLKP